MMTRRIRRHTARCALLLATVVAATATTFSREHEAHALAQLTSKSTWPGGVVPVCFDPSLASKPRFAEFVQVTRTNVENTWAKVANVRFTGWGICPAGPWPAGTAVLYYEAGGFNAAEGYSPTGPTTFKIDFNNNNPKNDNSSPARWAYFAVHEFGHILGFFHEMDRDDNPWYGGDKTACTPDGGGPPAGERKITPYDAQSVMNYCGAQNNIGHLEPYLGWMFSLSGWDVEGARSVYGPKAAGSLVGFGGRCVTVPGANMAMGTSLQTRDCDGSQEQVWRRPLDGYNRTFSVNIWNGYWGTTLAMDIPNAYVYPLFTTLWDYAWNGSVAQQFDFKAVQWKSIGDLCVQVGSTMTGAPLTMGTCTGTSALERWDFEPTGRVRLAGTSQCVNVPWASATTGNVLVLYPCGATPYPNEIYEPTNGGELKYGGKCLNVWGGNPTPGSLVALYDCAPSWGPSYYNERFHISGAARAEGQCLGTSYFSGAYPDTGTPVGVVPCNDPSVIQAPDPTASWDYYFALDRTRPLYRP